MTKVTQKRHIAKTISWRTIGTLDTMIIAWIVSGNPLAGLKIGLSEVCTKMILYYLHERVWARLDLAKNHLQRSRKRHFIKTVTWRVIGTLDTMFLSWLITGNPIAALKIGMTEVFTKMILYYLHERAWYRIKFGILPDGTEEQKNEEPAKQLSEETN